MADTKTVVDTSGPGISATFALFLVFLILKLTGVIAWSWWWVTAPLWIPPLAVISILTVVFAVIGSIVGVAALIDILQGKK